MKKQRTILIAPLNWGLGHATRCIPIIRSLLDYGFKVILASDGDALLLLRKEFPALEWYELPSYNITYPKNGNYFKWSLFLKLPHIKKTIASEKKIINSLLSETNIDGLISDNRYGVRSNKVPSVLITHQLNVLSGSTSFLSSLLHQKIIKKFDECWVPDVGGTPNLSGRLGHPKKTNLNLKYIGILSRMKKNELPQKYDVTAILSGPEPQRTLFEEKIIEALIGSKLKVLLVKGLVEEKQKIEHFDNITTFNFMQTDELEEVINASRIILSRSGYTTLMDLSVLEKKAFFVPTPGQYEQQYLAKRLKQLGIAPYCKQEDFSEKKLKEVDWFKGLSIIKQKQDLKELFGLFERK